MEQDFVREQEAEKDAKSQGKKTGEEKEKDVRRVGLVLSELFVSALHHRESRCASLSECLGLGKARLLFLFVFLHFRFPLSTHPLFIHHPDLLHTQHQDRRPRQPKIVEFHGRSRLPISPHMHNVRQHPRSTV